MTDPDSCPQQHVQTALIRELRETIERFRETEWESTYVDVLGAMECVKQNVLIEYAEALRKQQAGEQDEEQPT